MCVRLTPIKATLVPTVRSQIIPPPAFSRMPEIIAPDIRDDDLSAYVNEYEHDAEGKTIPTATQGWRMTARCALARQQVLPCSSMLQLHSDLLNTHSSDGWKKQNSIHLWNTSLLNTMPRSRGHPSSSVSVSGLPTTSF